MRTKIAMPAVVAAFLAVGATDSYAQGSITQDPGKYGAGQFDYRQARPQRALTCHWRQQHAGDCKPQYRTQRGRHNWVERRNDGLSRDTARLWLV
jgi:hypothetical protein